MPPQCFYQPTCPPGTTGTFPSCATAPQATAAGSSDSAAAKSSKSDTSPPNGGAAPAGNTVQQDNPDALTVAQRAALSHLTPQPEHTAASGGIALLVGGALAIFLCGIALLTKVRS